jgi:hypothetical protein
MKNFITAKFFFIRRCGKLTRRGANASEASGTKRRKGFAVLGDPSTPAEPLAKAEISNKISQLNRPRAAGEAGYI